MTTETENFATQMVEIRSKFDGWNEWPAATQTLKLAIGQWGDINASSENTFIMAHGITGNLHWWHVMARKLLEASSKSIRLIGFDIRGRGNSDKPESPYHVACSAADVEGLLAALDINGPVNFMGHSLGAHIGTYFASHYPKKTHRLFLIDGGAKLPADVGQSIAASRNRVGQIYPSYKDYVAPLKSAGIFPDWNEDVDRCYRYDCQEVPGGVSSKILKSAIDQEWDNLETFYNQVESYYPQIKAPTLILRAPQPIAAPLNPFLLPQTLDTMTNTIAGGCKVVNVEGTNHYTVIIKPTQDAINAIVESITNL